MIYYWLPESLLFACSYSFVSQNSGASPTWALSWLAVTLICLCWARFSYNKPFWCGFYTYGLVNYNIVPHQLFCYFLNYYSLIGNTNNDGESEQWLIILYIFFCMYLYIFTNIYCFLSNEYQSHLGDNVIESDGEADCPNPTDFLEACLVSGSFYILKWLIIDILYICVLKWWKTVLKSDVFGALLVALVCWLHSLARWRRLDHIHQEAMYIPSSLVSTKSICTLATRLYFFVIILEQARLMGVDRVITLPIL